MAEPLPPHRHDPVDPDDRAGLRRTSTRRRFRRSLRRFALAVVVVLVVGLGAGILFGRGDPERAARLVVAEFTVTEDAAPGERGPDPRLPTSGPDRGAPRCGVSEEPLTPAEQVVHLAAGVVLLQHAPEVTDADLDVLHRLGHRDRVLVAPSPALTDGEVVVATSWRHRMGLAQLDAALLDAFVTGHAGRAPAPRACPPTRP